MREHAGPHEPEQLLALNTASAWSSLIIGLVDVSVILALLSMTSGHVKAKAQSAMPKPQLECPDG